MNVSMIQKSDRFDARIMRYKQNGCRWECMISEILWTNLSWKGFVLMIRLCFPKITRIEFIVLKILWKSISALKLYALNEKENWKHPSCVAIPPPLWKISMPSCDARKKLRWLLPAVEFYAWCKTTWNNGGVENE